MKKKTVKKRNPQDAVRRNVLASIKRDAVLSERITVLALRLDAVTARVSDLERRAVDGGDALA